MTNHFRDLMVALFDRFEQRNIPYLVLRNYETLPDETTNDVDILIDPSFCRSAFNAVIAVAGESGWRVSNIGRYSCLSLFLFRPDSLQQTHVDLMLGNRWHSMSFADHASMLTRRVPFRELFAPSKVDEAWICFATRMLYGGYVKQKYRPLIQSVCLTRTEESISVFSAFLGCRLADEVVSLCARGDWEVVERLRGRVRRRVLLANFCHPGPFIARITSDVFRFVERFRFPIGIKIALVGRDTRWRDAVAEVLMHDMTGTFYPQKTFRWNGEPATGKTRYSVWKNAFHGGLSILDFPSGKTGEFRCDLTFSEESIHFGDPSFRFQVTKTVLEFLSERTARRHA